jgi:Na+-driven multidrug efflux pump
MASAVYQKILARSQVFMGLEVVLGGAFSGAGDTVPPMAVFVPFNLARILLAYLLAGPAGFGVDGVWWAISGMSIVKGLLIALWSYRGGWKHENV